MSGLYLTPALIEAAALRPVANAVDRPLADVANAWFPYYQITTPLRIAHFLAQGAHETDGFQVFSERGSGVDANHNGEDDYFERYDTRADLGNTPALDGDGQRYRGRGVFQLTGKANYAAMGKKLGVALEETPEIAADPATAMKIAVLWWADRGLNELADADDLKAITRKINGGLNGYEDRARRLWAVKRYLNLQVAA